MHFRSIKAALLLTVAASLAACGGSSDGGPDTTAAAKPATPTGGDVVADAPAVTAPSGGPLLVAKALIAQTLDTSEPVALTAVTDTDRSEVAEPEALR